MKAYKVTINNQVNNNIGEDIYFSSYDKVVDYIFKSGYGFFFRGTDIEESPKGLEEKLHEGNFETIRRVSQTWEVMPWLETTTEYCHISIINIQ